MIIVKLSERRIYSAKDNVFGNFGICTVMTSDQFDNKIFQYFHTDDRSSQLHSTECPEKLINKLYSVKRMLDIVRSEPDTE